MSHEFTRHLLGEAVVRKATQADLDRFNKKIVPDSVVKKIADATDINDHTGALIIAAKFLKLNKIVKDLENLDKEHMRIGHLSASLSDKRYKLSQEIFKTFEKKHGNAETHRIKGIK